VAVITLLVEPILYPRVGAVQPLSLQHRLDALEPQIVAVCQPDEFGFGLFGLFSLESAEHGAIVVLPEDFHIVEARAAQPL
jgi:hypothetical protein